MAKLKFVPPPTTISCETHSSCCLCNSRLKFFIRNYNLFRVYFRYFEGVYPYALLISIEQQHVHICKRVYSFKMKTLPHPSEGFREAHGGYRILKTLPNSTYTFLKKSSSIFRTAFFYLGNENHDNSFSSPSCK